MISFINSTFRISALITIIVFIILLFFVDNKFKTSSIINVTDTDSTPNVQDSLISSFVTSSPESLFQLKEFFESKDGLNELKKFTNFDETYGSMEISYFSRFGTVLRSNSQKYYNDVINFEILSDSNSIKIQSLGFNPESSYRINLILINIASEFFDRRDRLAASIALAKKRCELRISENKDINEVTIYNEEDSIDFDSLNSANQLIYEKSKRFYQSCLDYDVVEDPLSLQLPKSTLNDVNSFTSKQLIGEIFDSKMDSLTITDKISIVAEPQKATEPESKRIIILCLIVFIFSYITIMSLKILSSLKDEFKF